jgi:catechol 2,3-dioxygenase-like lactoylglutathione lyase family enzyme
MIDASSIRVTLLVLYSPRLEDCRRFYSELGLNFTTEKHGQGPTHCAAVLGGVVLEIYSALPDCETGTLRLGLAVIGAAATPPLNPGRHLLTDPDGRTVEIHVS